MSLTVLLRFVVFLSFMFVVSTLLKFLCVLMRFLITVVSNMFRVVLYICYAFSASFIVVDCFVTCVCLIIDCFTCLSVSFCSGLVVLQACKPTQNGETYSK